MLSRTTRHITRLMRTNGRSRATGCSVARSASSNSASDPDNKDDGGNTGNKKTHFGFQTVTEEEKLDKVQAVFTGVAGQYDRMNDAMSLGVHRLWKDHFVNQVLDPGPDTRLLDVAGGTGDVAFRFLDLFGSGEGESSKHHVTVCDINPDMLHHGRLRSAGRSDDPERISWRRGDAMALPFADAEFDAYTIAFGIRNVVKIEDVLSEAFRVLKPGGRFLCLEFSHVRNPLFSSLYDFYSFQVIPPLGKVIAGDWESYQYLVESIRRFPDQEAFADMIREAGFGAVTHEDLTGGIACIHSGFKL